MAEDDPLDLARRLGGDAQADDAFLTAVEARIARRRRLGRRLGLLGLAAVASCFVLVAAALSHDRLAFASSDSRMLVLAVVAVTVVVLFAAEVDDRNI